MKIPKKATKFLMIIVVLTAFLWVYLQIPSSPLRNQYSHLIQNLSQDFIEERTPITPEDLLTLPEILQAYFTVNGYVGSQSVNLVVIHFRDVDFSMGGDQPDLKLNYTVHTFSQKPVRAAFIESSLYSIPFQGMDYTRDGQTRSQGVFAKHITVFDTGFDQVDSAYLSECLLHPSLALQESISFRQLDDLSVEATLRVNDTVTQGTFYFNDQHQMIRFVDEQRYSASTDSYEKWSAVPSEYQWVEGIRRPTRFQAVWHYPDGDLIYFDGRHMEVEYR